MASDTCYAGRSQERKAIDFECEFDRDMGRRLAPSSEAFEFEAINQRARRRYAMHTSLFTHDEGHEVGLE